MRGSKEGGANATQVQWTPKPPATEVTVTHSLDKKLNDLPLTVKTRLPAGWKVAHFQHA